MDRLKALIVAFALLACLSAGPAAAENVLRWASAGGAATFDPHSFDETQTHAQRVQVYEALVGLDSHLELVPRLALEWRLVDPLTWEFKLRPNVRFHDGTPLTADDVVFSIARAKTELSPPVGVAAYIESIAQVRAVRSDTVRILTKSPDPQLPMNLKQISIMSERWATAHASRVPANVSAGEENFASRHANGTGAFILKESMPNGPVLMLRNPHWWGLEGYPHNIDRIEYIPIPDADKGLAALLRGDLDLLTAPPFSALDQIKSTAGLQLVAANQPRTVYLGLDQANTLLRSSGLKGRNPFKDKRVRQAIYQAIDVATIREKIMQGLSIPAGMMVAPEVNGYAPELAHRFQYDPQATRRLLAEAGYPQGFRVTLDCPRGSSAINAEAICRAVAGQLGRIGIDVPVNAQPKQLIYAKIDARESDFYLDSWGISTLDSTDAFMALYRTKAGLNASGYSNPRVDELTEQIGREMITYARDAMIEEVWRIVLDDIVYIPLHHQKIVWAMRDGLNAPVYPFGYPLFHEARMNPSKVN
jgi:peptide/nickel transport system substrate-binding protein